MSSIEERLTRDVADVAGNVVVTDSDLQEARADLNERIDSRRRRDRRLLVAAAAAAAVLVAGGVTALLEIVDDKGTARPAGPPSAIVDSDAEWLAGNLPTSQLLQGVWRLDNGDITLQFEPNGKVRFTEHGSLFAHPDATGTYAIHGDLITMITTRPAQQGCVDTHFGMRAALPHVGSMHFVRTGPPDAGCSPVPSSYARGTWEQALPTAPDLAGVVFSKDRRWEPLTDRFNLYGVVMPVGGGYLVEIDLGGAYYVADGSGAVVDRGRWTLRNSNLTLTTRTSSVCAKGDRFVLGGLQNETGLNGVRGTVRQDDCAGGWGAATFITIAHLSAS